MTDLIAEIEMRSEERVDNVSTENVLMIRVYEHSGTTNVSLTNSDILTLWKGLKDGEVRF